MYRLVIALWLFVSPWLLAPGQDYPAPADAYINDFAGVLSDTEQADVAARLARLYDETGIEAVVVTVPSFRDYGTGDRTLEIFATNLFNTWAIGDSELNNGALILLALNDREVRIELGSGYEDALNDRVQRIIDDQMIPRFRENAYGVGLRDGALALADVLAAEAQRAPDAVGAAHTRAPAPTPSGAQIGGQTGPAAQPASAPPDAEAGGSTPLAPLLVVPGGLGVLGLGGYGLYRLLDRRSRRCPNCGNEMHVLDEIADDVHLTSGQKVEELLNSVNYDVWNCDQCGNHVLRSRRRLFSGYENCPSCNYQTLKVQRQQVVAPTYDMTGTERIQRDCANCNYHNTNDVTIPRLVRSTGTSGARFSGSQSSRRSSGSSRSSFGGGRSRGGGASGKW